LLLRGKLPISGLGDKRNTNVWNEGEEKPKEEGD
jgi:hypothetical protein